MNGVVVDERRAQALAAYLGTTCAIFALGSGAAAVYSFTSGDPVFGLLTSGVAIVLATYSAWCWSFASSPTSRPSPLDKRDWRYRVAPAVFGLAAASFLAAGVVNANQHGDEVLTAACFMIGCPLAGLAIGLWAARWITRAKPPEAH
jgi:hypothetical protein